MHGGTLLNSLCFLSSCLEHEPNRQMGSTCELWSDMTWAMMVTLNLAPSPQFGTRRWSFATGRIEWLFAGRRTIGVLRIFVRNPTITTCRIHLLHNSGSFHFVFIWHIISCTLPPSCMCVLHRVSYVCQMYYYIYMMHFCMGDCVRGSIRSTIYAICGKVRTRI